MPKDPLGKIEKLQDAVAYVRPELISETLGSAFDRIPKKGDAHGTKVNSLQGKSRHFSNGSFAFLTEYGQSMPESLYIAGESSSQAIETSIDANNEVTTDEPPAHPQRSWRRAANDPYGTYSPTFHSARLPNRDRPQSYQEIIAAKQAQQEKVKVVNSLSARHEDTMLVPIAPDPALHNLLARMGEKVPMPKNKEANASQHSATGGVVKVNTAKPKGGTVSVKSPNQYASSRAPDVAPIKVSLQKVNTHRAVHLDEHELGSEPSAAAPSEKTFTPPASVRVGAPYQAIDPALGVQSSENFLPNQDQLTSTQNEFAIHGKQPPEVDSAFLQSGKEGEEAAMASLPKVKTDELAQSHLDTSEHVTWTPELRSADERSQSDTPDTDGADVNQNPSISTWSPELPLTIKSIPADQRRESETTWQSTDDLNRQEHVNPELSKSPITQNINELSRSISQEGKEWSPDIVDSTVEFSSVRKSENVAEDSSSITHHSFANEGTPENKWSPDLAEPIPFSSRTSQSGIEPLNGNVPMSKVSRGEVPPVEAKTKTTDVEPKSNEWSPDLKEGSRVDSHSDQVYSSAAHTALQIDGSQEAFSPNLTEGNTSNDVVIANAMAAATVKASQPRSNKSFQPSIKKVSPSGDVVKFSSVKTNPEKGTGRLASANERRIAEAKIDAPDDDRALNVSVAKAEARFKRESDAYLKEFVAKQENHDASVPQTSHSSAPAQDVEGLIEQREQAWRIEFGKQIRILKRSHSEEINKQQRTFEDFNNH